MASPCEVVLQPFSRVVPRTAALLVVVQRHMLVEEDPSVFKQIRQLLEVKIP